MEKRENDIINTQITLMNPSRSAGRDDETEALIDTSEIIENIDSDDQKCYELKIRYKYVWRGNEYYNNRLTFRLHEYLYPNLCLLRNGDEIGKKPIKDKGKYMYYFSYSRNQVEKTLKHFQPNQRLRIYVNPFNPTEAVVEPGKDFTSYIVSIFFIVVILIGLGDLIL